MPRSSQNRSASMIASCTAGFSKLRSGWWEKKRCQKYCLRTGSKVQLERLGVDEDDPGVGVAAVVVGPDVEVAVRAVGVAAATPGTTGAGREVWFMTKSMITRMPRSCAASTNSTKSPRSPNSGSTVGVVADVVAAVAQRRGEERRQPEAVDAEPLQVVELVGQAAQVAGAVAVAVVEAADEHLVEDRALVPVRVGAGRRQRGAAGGESGTGTVIAGDRPSFGSSRARSGWQGLRRPAAGTAPVAAG